MLNRRLRERIGLWRWSFLNLLDRLLWPRWREKRIGRTAAAGRIPMDPHVTEILVDVSVIAKSDAGTGIQRVVKGIVAALPDALSPDQEAIFLHVRSLKHGYETADGSPFTDGPQAVFFGLDFATDSIHRSFDQLGRLRRSGTQMWFVVHDLLPLTCPHWFTAPSQLKYRRWIRALASLADGLVCFSDDVAAELAAVLSSRFGREQLPCITVVQPGSAISNLDPLASHETAEDRNSPWQDSVLIVGTIEPRKGHADALAAFDRLWATGNRTSLTLIGRPGWGTKRLQKKILSHPEFGRRLFWAQNASDEEVRDAYRAAKAVLIPSLAEGYGLPIDEALSVGAIVLARDIAVFRRELGGDIRFFPKDSSPSELADFIRDNLGPPHSPPPPFTASTWDSAARKIVSAFSNCDSIAG